MSELCAYKAFSFVRTIPNLDEDDLYDISLFGENEIFQVIVVGGSIMKIASVETLPDTLQILDIETGRQKNRQRTF